MELTHTYVTHDDSTNIGTEHDLVEVEETIALDEDDMERVLHKVVDGVFCTMSERGIWNTLADIGTVVERNESVVGGF